MPQSETQEWTLHDAGDVAAALRSLTDGKSARTLAREYWALNSSVGGWWAWLNGKRMPLLEKLLPVAAEFGAEVVIRRTPE